MPILVPIINFEPQSGDRKKEAEAFISRHVVRDFTDDPKVKEVSEAIVWDVRERGDAAVLEYTKKHDKADLTAATLKVTDAELKEAADNVPDEYKNIIKRAIRRIRRYHEKQRQNSWFDTSKPGEILGQLITPLDSVGVYVPNGTAPLPSSLLMEVVPAKVADVGRIIMTTPPNEDGKVPPVLLYAAAEAGVDEIYKIGGAQAIAALAFGTETVPKVDKIVGPGSIYVIMAKRAVFGYVGIDSMAGPSDIAIAADNNANPAYVAADMLSQAEHDERAAAILVTTSQTLAEAVQEQLVIQTNRLNRREIIKKSLNGKGLIILADDEKNMFHLINAIAAEHLEICTADPFEKLTYIKHAGAIFLGNYTTEPLGDYMAGPSHILPTEGTARFFSPVSVDDFIKKSSVLSFSREAMERLQDDVAAFARSEGLDAHAAAIEIRKG